MKLCAYYTVISLALDALAVFLCLEIEKYLPWISMPIFLTLYFLILWVSWIIAVKMTETDEETAPQVGATSDQRA